MKARFAKKKFRSLLLGEAKGHTNEWLRTKCRVRSVFSVLLAKRLGFCRSILRLVGRLDAPDSDLPPLLLGRGHAVGSEQITDTGELLKPSNPWLKQFVRDVVFAMQHNHLDADMSLDPRTWMMNARYATTPLK